MAYLFSGDLFDLYHGDCIEVLRSLPDCSIDAVITDPPYSSGTRREGSKGIRKSMLRSKGADDWFASDCLTTDGFWWLMHATAVQCGRVMRPGSHFLSFIDWRMWPHLSGAVEAADLRRYGMLVWDKTYFGMGQFFRNQHELILHFSKGKPRKASRHDVGNVLCCKPIRNGAHPTEKPVELIETLLSVVCQPGDVVLDPFCGGGATLLAASNQEIESIGIECDPKSFSLARSRLLKNSERAA